MTSVQATNESEQKAKAQVREMTAHFLVPKPKDQLFAELDSAAAALDPAYRQILSAFRGSISAAISTISLPYFPRAYKRPSKSFSKNLNGVQN